MELLDYIIIILFFILLILIGVYSYKKVSSSADFFTASGKLPWWVIGVSHHVSGYSGAVFVAYASIAYTHGLTIYVWWAFTIAIAMVGTVFFIAPRWARLRSQLKIQSPTEYLSTRYNIPTQQVMAWGGVLLKLFDVSAKWLAIGIILNTFLDISITVGIVISAVINLIYVTLGGIMADALNDFVSFIVQLVAGIAMFIVVLMRLGDGISGVFTVWDRLPPENSQLFNSPYTFGFALAFLVINFFSYSGGTWNLAAKFISANSGKEAKRSALLSAVLYLVWPLILFFPMFAAPIFFPGLEDTEQAYSLMALEFLPAGLKGLLVASIFSTTLTMTASDSNTISSVITRDILPILYKKLKVEDSKKMLRLARITTFSFILITVVIALNGKHFGGVIGLIVTWVAGLVGPVAIPMILGLLPVFRKSGSFSAIISIIGGMIMFFINKSFWDVSQAAEVALPLIVSLILYLILGLLSRNKVPEGVDKLLEMLKKD